MNIKIRWDRVTVVSLCLLAFLVGLLAPWDSLPWNQAAQTLYEDQAGWNCETMGNRVCGD
jgi:hypothetical protein